jgi:hypothetical protein
MKKLILFTVLLLPAFFLQAQKSILRYEFQNTLAEKNGNGPELTVLGNTGVYVLDTLNEISGLTKTVYRFENNSGFQFNNAGANNFIGDSYTIEIYFVFDELTSWKRVVDWKNRKTDYGAYVYYGELNFYPYIYSEEAPVEPGEYTYYVITRDGATGQLLIYTDADMMIDFTDTEGDALVDGDNVINFFHDDLIVPNESSAGAVALLNFYNFAIDSNEVKTNFENIGGQVFSVKEIRKANTLMNVYPNPANDFATIDLSGFKGQEVNVTLLNATGSTIYAQSISGLNNNLININLASFPEGIYLVRAESLTNLSTRKLVIRR